MSDRTLVDILRWSRAGLLNVADGYNGARVWLDRTPLIGRGTLQGPLLAVWGAIGLVRFVDPQDLILAEAKVTEKQAVNELVDSVVALRDLLGETGDYGICRNDKTPMGWGDLMQVGGVLERVSVALRQVVQEPVEPAPVVTVGGIHSEVTRFLERALSGLRQTPVRRAGLVLALGGTLNISHQWLARLDAEGLIEVKDLTAGSTGEDDWHFANWTQEDYHSLAAGDWFVVEPASPTVLAERLVAHG
ncbi:MAG: hypothetical protein IPO08_23760 [Xanthomonadales bacterium]|nr:hypothetical protein [Xanthomonadales bacterium]